MKCLASLLRFFSSLPLGIALLILILVLLAWGTFIESEYGAATARFVLYGTPWFAALQFLLAVNIFANSVCRFAQKKWRMQKSDIPFLTTHAGILLLLFGCLLTWYGGEEAQITLPEGIVGNTASRPDRQQFTLQLLEHAKKTPPEKTVIPFVPGPFDWNEDARNSTGKRYQTSVQFAAKFAHRDKGKLRTGNPDVQLEVLDYYADSALEPVPPLELNVRWKHRGEKQETGNWEPVTLAMTQPAHSPVHGFDVRGAAATMSQGERVTYCLASCERELTAFQMEQKPQVNGGSLGSIALMYGIYWNVIDVDDLLRDGSHTAFTHDLMTIGNVRYNERGPIIHFTLTAPSGEKETMTLFPDNPEMNVHARRLGVFGSYCIDPQKMMKEKPELAEHPVLQRAAKPRLDFMQSNDGKLYYRLWTGQKVVQWGFAKQTVPFKIAEGTPNEVEVIVTKIVPQDVPGYRVIPATNKQHGQHGQSHGQMKEPRVKLRMSVLDSPPETFWLRGIAPTVVPLPPQPDQIRYLYGYEKSLGIQLDFAKIDLGFGIFLKKFEQRTEPGTRMSSHFSSLVDYVVPKDSAKTVSPTGEIFSPVASDFRPLPAGENVLISMNLPGYFCGTGRGWRIYQSSYLGPFYPDQPQFHELYDGEVFPWESKPRESIAMSTLSVNSDPGRTWKYLGCLLLVLGTVMFVWRSSAVKNYP